MEGYSTLSELIDHLEDNDADRAAVQLMRRSGIDEWSYRRLSEHARKLACGLGSENGAAVKRGESVALVAGNRPEWIAACLGIMRAGAVATPLDVQTGDDTLKRIVDDADVHRVFTDASQLERLEEIDFGRQLHFHLLDAEEEDDERSWLRLLADDAEKLPEITPDDFATLFYTSGTTGPPKGVPLKHANVTPQIAALREAKLLTEGDPILLPLPLHHVYPFVMGMLVPLALGATIVLPRSRTGPELVRALREGEVTRIIGVPRLYRAMYDGLQSKARNAGAISSLYFTAGSALSNFARRRLGIRNAGKLIMRPLHWQFGPKLELLASGGSPLDPELAWKLEGLGWRVAVGYGLTETSPLLTLMTPDQSRFDTVGKPIKDVEIKIDTDAVPDEDSEESNGQAGNEKDENINKVEGEVLARGPNVFEGYRNLPEKSKEVLTDGWFRTGDLGYLDEDGFLHLTGRASTLIVTEGGKNIQPDEVEESYSKHPRLREVGILQKGKQLVALVVPEKNELPSRNGGGDATAIRKFVREAVEEKSRELPSYQRIGDFTITRQSLPRTRLGKLRRHKLEELYEEVNKRGDEPEDEKAEPISIEEMNDEDRTTLRHSAAKHVWEWFAKRYPDRRVTPDSSPQLDLGIDSMEWLNLTLEIGQRAGVELSEETISEVESIRELLERVVEASDERSEQVRQPLVDPDAVLSDEQKRWLEPLSSGRQILASVLRKLIRLVMRLSFRLEVRGLANLPRDRQLVLVPNHLSHLDPFVLTAALDDQTLSRTHWGAWTGIALRNPINRFISRLAQIVPVDPQRAAMSSLALGSAVLKRERNLVWFPEGERSETGELQEFRPGIGMLLDHYRSTTVTPIFIQGTYEAMPVGRMFPVPHRVTVIIGEPLAPDQLEHEGEGEAASDRITQALREHVAKMGRG